MHLTDTFIQIDLFNQHILKSIHQMHECKLNVLQPKKKQEKYKNIKWSKIFYKKAIIG